MRIVFEDEELEGFVMDGSSMIAVPVQIDVPEDGESVLTVYSGFARLAEKFAKKFEDDPLSPDALRFIEDHFTKPMAKAGYNYESDFDHLVLNYEAEDEYLTDPGHGDAVVFIDTDEKLASLYLNTTRDFRINDADPVDVAFAVVKGDTALSVASVNDFSDDGSVEINVETAPNERGQGYGSAVTYALCRHLLSLGKRVSFRCRSTNAPSQRIAEKCGLTYKGKTYSFVCYKD